MGSTLALAHPLYYNRLVELASTSKFVHQGMLVTYSKPLTYHIKMKINNLINIDSYLVIMYLKSLIS